MVSVYRFNIYSSYMAMHERQDWWSVWLHSGTTYTISFDDADAAVMLLFFVFYSNTQTFRKRHVSLLAPTLLPLSFSVIGHRFLTITLFILRFNAIDTNKPLWKVQNRCFLSLVMLINSMAKIFHQLHQNMDAL